MTQLAGQTILVTGANRGLGKEFVAQLLDRGAAKVYAAARDASTIATDDPRVVPLQLDVTDAESVRRAAATAADVTVVVNNAGLLVGGSVLDPDTSSLRRELETNLIGPLTVASAFAAPVTAAGGAIVNVASVLSWVGLGGTYGVSKAGFWSAIDSMRFELAPQGVQVVGVYVGYVDTDMTVGVEAPKSVPADVIRTVLDGVEAGALEVLADDMTRSVKANLHLPIEEQFPQLAEPVNA
jgi:NAD(P)-dependent dehydrogenase (short-subunit alcohol dehydrogenase family)